MNNDYIRFNLFTNFHTEQVGQSQVEPEIEQDQVALGVEGNHLGELHVYVPQNNGELATSSKNSYSAAPIQSEVSPAKAKEPAPSSSAWAKALSWAGEKAVDWLEQPAEKDLQDLFRAVGQIRQPVEEISSRERVSGYTNLVKNTSSVAKLGMKVLGFSEVAQVLGVVSQGVGGIGMAHNYFDPEPNFKNLKKATLQTVDRAFKQRLTHTDYKELKEKIEESQINFSQRADLIQSTEELVSLLEDLQDDFEGIDSGLKSESKMPDLKPLLDKARQTARNTERKYGETLERADHSLDQLEKNIDQLNRKQDSIKKIRPSEIARYTELRIRLWSKKEELVRMREQLVDKSIDETSRLRVADRIDEYLKLNNFTSLPMSEFPASL